MLWISHIFNLNWRCQLSLTIKQFVVCTFVGYVPILKTLIEKPERFYFLDINHRIAAMETILEQQRSYHEERERTMDAMVKEILHKKTGVSIVIMSLVFCLY